MVKFILTDDRETQIRETSIEDLKTDNEENIIKMWHEARKQERKIRGIIVDRAKRAERRHEFYSLIKADPNQFLRLHGMKCKVHIDLPETSDPLIPWQGHKDILIDRFDARTHLDCLPMAQKQIQTSQDTNDFEERHLNYERYRVLVMNEFLGVSEEKFLHQLQLEEQFGTSHLEEKGKKKGQGVAIDFQYEENTPKSFSQAISSIETTSNLTKYEEFSKDSSDSDLDLSLDMKKIGTDQAHGLNVYGHRFGMQSNDFYSFLTKDLDDAEALKIAQEEEQEKVLYCGRKGRRERRAQRERRFHIRVLDADTKPSYAKIDDLNKKIETESKHESDSRSPSPDTAVTFITSFGGEEEQQKHTGMSYSDKLKENLNKLKRLNEIQSHKYSSRRRRNSKTPPRAKRQYRRSSKSSRSSPETSRKNQKYKPRSPPQDITPVERETVFKKYYGRKRNNGRSSTESEAEDKDTELTHKYHDNKPSVFVSKPPSADCKPSTSGTSKITARDMLKRKMQILLNKQYKEDKKIETLKKIQQLQEQRTRESEMREIALKLRKRQRELRHRYGTPKDSNSSDSSDSSKSNKSRSSSSSSSNSRSKSPEHRYSPIPRSSRARSPYRYYRRNRDSYSSDRRSHSRSSYRRKGCYKESIAK